MPLKPRSSCISTANSTPKRMAGAKLLRTVPAKTPGAKLSPDSCRSSSAPTVPTSAAALGFHFRVSTMASGHSR